MTNWARRWTTLKCDDGVESSGQLGCAECGRLLNGEGTRILLVRQPDKSYLVYCATCGEEKP